MLMAKKGGKSRRSFVSLEDYFLYGKEQDVKRDAAGERLYRPDLVAHWSRGVANDATAGLEMEAVAGKSKANEANPLLHFVISTRKGEPFSEEQARVAVDAAMRSLGADRSHAYKAATHYDEDDGRFHTHVMANRRSTRTGKLLDMHNDFFKLARAAEWCERGFGLQVDRKPDWRKRVSDRDLGMEVELAPVRERAQAVKQSWTSVIDQALPAMKAARTWDDIHAALQPFGATIRQSGGGFAIVGPERGNTVKLSALGAGSADAISARELRERLGVFVPSEPAAVGLKAKAAMPAADVIAAKAAIIARNPDVVIETLAETRSTWTPEDVVREVAAKLGVPFEQRDQHREAFARANVGAKPPPRATTRSSPPLLSGPKKTRSLTPRRRCTRREPRRLPVSHPTTCSHNRRPHTHICRPIAGWRS
jgi:hypothetical protein